MKAQLDRLFSRYRVHEARTRSIYSIINGFKIKANLTKQPDSGVSRYSLNKPSDQAYFNLRPIYNYIDISNAQHVMIKIGGLVDTG